MDAALGDSARYLWLKLPYCENYELVANSTTLPILLLGGEPVGDATPFLRELAAGLKAGPCPDLAEFAASWTAARRFLPQMDEATRARKWAGWREAVSRTLTRR